MASSFEIGVFSVREEEEEALASDEFDISGREGLVIVGVTEPARDVERDLGLTWDWDWDWMATGWAATIADGDRLSPGTVLTGEISVGV